jgi:hypothetical protein
MNIYELSQTYTLLGLFVIVVLLPMGLAVMWLRIPPVPTRKKEEDLIFKMANLKPGEVFYDLGAGEGKLVKRALAEYKAKAWGWELNPPVWFLGWLKTRRMNLGDLWQAPVEHADVVVTFLMPSVMRRVEQEIWPKLKPGARLISNAFALPGVTPTKTEGWVYLYQKQ